MKGILILSVAILLASCASEEDRIKSIIDDSYYGIYELNKMSEIEKQDEHVYSLKVHYSRVEKYAPIDKESDYVMVRYIYKTYEGVYRIFYLIDMTNRKVIDKSSDYNDFFRPVASEILGDNIWDMEGNNIIDLMSY